MDELFLSRLESALTTAITNAIGTAGRQTPADLLDYTEVMKILKVNADDAYRVMKTIPHMKLGRLKVRRQALENWLIESEGYDVSDPAHPVKFENIA